VYNSYEESRKRGVFLDISNAQIKENIAQNLKNLRETYNLTQKNVSDTLGIDAASYRNWENKRSVPSVSALFEIAKIYKISINQLCGIEVNGGGSYLLMSPNQFNKDIYGENKITDLDAYEKQLIMKIRRLTNDDKRKVGECINELLKTEE